MPPHAAIVRLDSAASAAGICPNSSITASNRRAAGISPGLSQATTSSMQVMERIYRGIWFSPGTPFAVTQIRVAVVQCWFL